MIFCPKCGAQSETGKFCRLCGTNLALVSDVLGESESAARSVATRSGGTTLGLFNTLAVSNAERDMNGHTGCAVFSKLMIDLEASPLGEAETSIGVFAVFGSAEVFVPDDVAIRVTGASIFGGVKVRGRELGSGVFGMNEYSTPGYSQSPRRLHIDATAIFGEIKIK